MNRLKLPWYKIARDPQHESEIIDGEFGAATSADNLRAPDDADAPRYAVSHNTPDVKIHEI